jgi:hypothetical protein
MAVTQVGVVAYADDPTNPVRVVHPQVDDSELDDPQWTRLGLDPMRPAMLTKYLARLWPPTVS